MIQTENKFFHMKNNSYTLATNYDKLKVEFSQTESNFKIPSNIFSEQNLRLQTPQQLPLLGTKRYQIVGLKELKNYEQKLRKDRKNTCRKATYFQQERTTSRSSIARSKEYLNKQDILDGLPALQNRNDRKALKKVKLGPLLTQTSSVSHSLNYKASLQSLAIGREFSIHRLKQSAEQKDQEWNKLLQRISRSDPKFPSVFRKIEEFRRKIQKRQKDTILHELPINCSSKWPSLLRNDIKIGQLSQRKEITKTLHRPGDLSARGVSKLIKEQKWLDQKEDEGYQFKLLKSGLQTQRTIDAK